MTRSTPRRDCGATIAVESERAKIENLQREIDQFIAFRKELVRKAQFEDTASARAFGDNDANRKVRSALNDELVALGKAYADHTRRAQHAEVRRINELNHDHPVISSPPWLCSLWRRASSLSLAA